MLMEVMVLVDMKEVVVVMMVVVVVWMVVAKELVSVRWLLLW